LRSNFYGNGKKNRTSHLPSPKRKEMLKNPVFLRDKGDWERGEKEEKNPIFPLSFLSSSSFS